MIDYKKSWDITILTLFPEIFPGPLQYSLAGKALNKNIWNLEILNLRSFAKDKHQTVDDKPFGGGAGMVIKPDVLGDAIDSLLQKYRFDEIIYLSPRGKLFNQQTATKLVQHNKILMICGRYEGIDQRIIDYYNITEISIGDYILSGGEIAALTILDSCIRLLPNVIKNHETLNEESFSYNNEFQNLLEYPLYTRPFKWKNLEVPEILTSGHHLNITKWRKFQAEEITKLRRPELWKNYSDKKID